MATDSTSISCCFIEQEVYEVLKHGGKYKQFLQEKEV